MSIAVKLPPHADIAAAIAIAVLSLFVLFARASPSAGAEVTREVIRVEVPAGAANVDVYWPSAAASAPAPLVIVAHGFARDRGNMSGWGEHLARAGFVAVVPDLPSLSDHARNGRFLSELRAYLLGNEPWKKRVDPARVGLMGFSAGGLSSLLSAVDSPGLAIWVGLDPVDREGLGAKAAPMLQARALVLTAEPSSCNAHGNARDIVSALPRGDHSSIGGAVHVDAEWPTSWLAELVCGRSSDERRAEFQVRATKALKEAFESATPLSPSSAPGAGDCPRAVRKVAIPGTPGFVAVAEGQCEPRSVGSYSLRVYAGANPRFPFDDFVAGTVRSRDGVVEDVRLSDLDRDGLPEIVVVMRTAGTGNYLSADAFRFRGGELTTLGSVSGLSGDADPVRALEAELAKRADRGVAPGADKPRR